MDCEKKFDKKRKITQNIYENFFIFRGETDEMEESGKSGAGLIAKRVTCGVLVGGANSLFGGGGGMLAVPLLRATGYDEKSAHATAILVILPVSLFSFLLYFFRGLYDFSVLIPTALGVTAGGFLGSLLLGKMQTKTVNLIFAALQLAAGVFLFFF